MQRAIGNIKDLQASQNKDINLPELNSNQTVLQMISDKNAATDLRLPQVLQNLGQTECLGAFSPLRDSQIVSNSPSQFLSAKKDSSNAISSINNIEPKSTRIQPKYDQPNQINSDIQENNSSGWSNIAELLSNLPPPKISSNPSTNSLNQKSDNSSDRSYLANSSTNTSSQASSQAIIQRSPDHNYQNNYQNSKNNNNDLELYITPKGLQRDNPNQKSNSQSPIIQRVIASQQESEDLPEAQVTVNSIKDSNDINESANFEENLTALAQEIYVLLRQRLEIEKERQGSRYQGRLPW